MAVPLTHAAEEKESGGREWGKGRSASLRHIQMEKRRKMNEENKRQGLAFSWSSC